MKGYLSMRQGRERAAHERNSVIMFFLFCRQVPNCAESHVMMAVILHAESGAVEYRALN